MSRPVWILPVGLEYDRVLESLKFGGREFHIIYSATADEVSSAAKGYADRIREYLESGPFKVKGFHPVDVLDMKACIQLLKDIVAKERAEPGDEPFFQINVGTSSKIVTLAGFYLAAQDPGSFELWYPKAKDYVVNSIVAAARQVAEAHRTKQDLAGPVGQLSELLESYARSGGTSRRDQGYSMFRVPVIPVQQLTRTQQAILQALQTAWSFESSSALAEMLFAQPDTLGAKQVDGAKSSVSFAVHALEDLRLVEVRSVGRKKEIHLTESGQLYYEIFLRSPMRARDSAPPASTVTGLA